MLHHLARLAPDPLNTIVLCGFQAAGTRGRDLAEGADAIKVHGRYVPLGADVLMIESMSVHADVDGLSEWVERLPRPPTTVFVVHGEQDQSRSLARTLHERTGITAVVRRPFERVLV
ncbi:MAG: MBL fold metallo-hydrolase RNA specificity domain-containing protein [Acidimicrobiia bacterium]|nr:MBL fold metallo-hydrolase RNA specificity domain-containing protein [Acidimicrobiia bacterium]